MVAAVCVIESCRQALDATLAARDQLAAVAHQLEEKVQVMHAQLMQLPQLQHELKQLREQQQQLDKEKAMQMQVCTACQHACLLYGWMHSLCLHTSRDGCRRHSNRWNALVMPSMVLLRLGSN
jgi:hypothetical protein